MTQQPLQILRDWISTQDAVCVSSDRVAQYGVGGSNRV